MASQDPQAQLQTILQDKLDHLDQYEGPDQELIKQAAAKFGIQPRSNTQQVVDNTKSAFPFLGNMLDSIGEGVSNRLQGLGNIFQTVTNPANIKHFVQNPISDPAHLGLQMLEGMGQDMRQQQQQGLQQMQTDPAQGMLRALTGSVPGIGPAINQWVDKLGQNPGGATGDALMTGVDLAGPELLKGLLGPERAAGRALYDQSFTFPHDISLADRNAIKNLGFNLDLPATGQRSIGLLGDIKDPNTFIGGLEKGVQDNIAKVRTKPINMMKVVEPLMDEISGIDPRSPGAPEIRKALTDELQTYLKQNGFTKKHPTMNPLTVEEAQSAKRDAYRLISDSYYGDTKNLPPAKKRAQMLLAKGLKDAIEEQAPGVKPYNDQMHIAIQLQDNLIDAEKRNPGVLKNWGRYIVGGGGALAGAGMAEASGHPLLGGVGLAGLLAATLIRDPAAASRLGLAMSHAGTGSVTKALGLLPLAGRLGSTPNGQ